MRRSRRTPDRSPAGALKDSRLNTAPVSKHEARWLRPLVIGLLLFVLVSWLSRKTADSDTWWHLKTGQFMVTQHRLPVPDPFAWTTYLGKPLYPGEEATRFFNLTHEWLAQVALYAVYAASGLTGLVLMRAVCLTLFCALAGLMAYRRTFSFYRALGAAIAVAIVMHSFPEDRPQYFTYLFLALTINLLDFRRWLWLLPPLFLIWANCHGGFFLGWVAIASYWAESVYAKWRGTAIAGARNLWAAGVSAILLSGVNPNGFHVFQVLRNYRNSPLQGQIIEWFRPNPWEVSPFTVLLYGGLLMLLWNRRSARLSDWLLFVAFGSAGLLAWRNVVFAAWVGAFVIAVYFPARIGPKNRHIMEYAIAGTLLATIGVLIAKGQALRLHAAIDEPVGPAADFLLQHHIQGRLLNSYAEGGYLIWRLWPRFQVFADGRALNEGVAQDLQRILLAVDDNAGRSGEDLLKEYGIDVIVMSAFEPISGRAFYLPAALADPQQSEWKLVFRDAHELIYVKRPPPDVMPLNQLDGLVGMEEQCSFLVNAGAPACTLGMIDVFTRIGDQERALKWTGIRRFAHLE